MGNANRCIICGADLNVYKHTDRCPIGIKEPKQEKECYMSITFSNIPLTLAEEIKNFLLLQVPVNTSYSVHFGEAITDDDEPKTAKKSKESEQAGFKKDYERTAD